MLAGAGDEYIEKRLKRPNERTKKTKRKHFFEIE